MSKRTFCDEKPIGSGGFGDLFSAQMVDGEDAPRTVALKKSTLRKGRPASVLNKRLRKEYGFLKKL